MINKHKLILMSKLAVYDKNHAEKDNKILSYFRNDYIYRQNVWVRFGIIVGCIIFLMFFIMHKIAVDGADMLFGFDYKPELVRIGVFVVALLIIYSCIGSGIYLRDYQKALNRNRNYFKIMDELDKLSEAPTPVHRKAQNQPVKSGYPVNNTPKTSVNNNELLYKTVNKRTPL